MASISTQEEWQAEHPEGTHAQYQAYVAGKNRMALSYKSLQQRYIQDWLDYGTGAPIPGVDGSGNVDNENYWMPISGSIQLPKNKSGEFIQGFAAKYNIPYGTSSSPDWPNSWSGDLHLPIGVKISQEDMWEWQRIAVAAKRGWVKAWEYQQKIEGNYPVLPKQSTMFSNPSWTNKELISNPIGTSQITIHKGPSPTSTSIPTIPPPGTQGMTLEISAPGVVTEVVDGKEAAKESSGGLTRAYPSSSPNIVQTGSKKRADRSGRYMSKSGHVARFRQGRVI